VAESSSDETTLRDFNEGLIGLVFLSSQRYYGVFAAPGDGKRGGGLHRGAKSVLKSNPTPALFDRISADPAATVEAQPSPLVRRGSDRCSEKETC
jgi:hypothetical protein